MIQCLRTRSTRFCWYIAIVLAVALVGCGKKPSETAPAQVLPTVAFTPTATPTPPPSPTPSPTPPPCPPRQAQPLPAQPASFGAYPTILEMYLADGGDPANLPTILDTWQARPFEGVTMLRADLTGNAVAETAVSYTDPNSETFPPASQLAVYACQRGTVATMYTYSPGEWLGLALVGVQDLTQDAVADLTFAEISCGAHTCWHTLHVWSWQGTDFQPQMGRELTMPYATFILEDAPSLNGGQILALSGGIGSVGAGPQRAYTETWAWNGSVITLTSAEVGPATYRYHVFRDGDEAWFQQNYDDAYWAYLNVITDQTLKAWEGYYTAAEEKLWLTALAHWRLVLMSMKLENYEDAKAHYAQLQSDFTPEIPGYPVAALAKRFWDRYLEVGNIAYGCQEVVNAPKAQTVLDFLNSYGYANPMYAPEELCPYLTP